MAKNRTRSLIAVLTIGLLSALLTSAPATAREIAPAAFNDVPSGSYYADAVDWLADAAITTGTGPTSFSPDDAVTRGQMAAFLERYAQVEGDPGEHGFGDVPAGAYFDGSVSFLVDNDITTGTSPTTYSPNDVVTRAQMATFLWRFSNEAPSDAAMPFNDVPAGTYYYDAVRWLADKGITTGTSATTYAPNDSVTRAQMATFLWRLADEPNVGELGVNRRDLDVSRVADEDDADFTVLDGDGTSTLQWTGNATPTVGQVLGFGISDETPYGFLGKVTGVSGDTVTTEPATLTDAIPEADFDLLVDLDESNEADPQGLSVQSVIDKALQSARLECSAEAEVWVEASLTVEPSMTLQASWGPVKGAQFRAGLEIEMTPEIRGHAGGKVECSASISVDGPKLNPITFVIGGFPVVIVPSLSFEAELYANFAASAEPYVKYTETVGVEIVYDDGWTVEYPTDGGDGLEFGVDYQGDATVGLELRARLDLLAYDVVGLYLTLGPFIEITAQFDDPWWALDVGIRARAGVAVSLFDLWEEDWEFGQIDLYRKTLAQAPVNDPAQPDDFVDVANLRTTQVDAGDYHTCAITTAGEIACWGQNSRYQLGLGNANQQNVPAIVDPISTSDPIDISAGGAHSCAVFADGTIECWGMNDDGQIGDGSTDSNATTPRQVTGITNARRVEAGGDHTCALLIDFSVSCWGNGDHGALGQGDQADHNTPQPVEGLGPVVDLATSVFHTCVAIADGSAWCWGNNGYDEVDPTDSAGSIPLPRKVAGYSTVTGVGAGFGVTCLINDGGYVDCWGRNNNGQTGTDSTANSVTTPTRVPYLEGVTSLSVGHQHSCAVQERTVSGTLYRTAKCWGYNLHSQTAVNTHFEKILFPGDVTGADPAIQISAGRAHSCAQTDTGRTECWGLDNRGQLGNDEALETQHSADYVQDPFTSL